MWNSNNIASAFLISVKISRWIGAFFKKTQVYHQAKQLDIHNRM